MAGALLRTGHLRDYAALGTAGHQVYTAAPQLRSSIKRMVTADHSEMLAIPQINEAGDSISWYAPFDGVVVPWSAATEEERAPARDSLKAMRQTFIDRSQAILEGKPSSRDAVTFAHMLPLSAHIPDETHIYLVDGRPVITFWGFDPTNGGPNPDTIRDLRAWVPPAEPVIPAQVPPQMAPPPVAPVVEVSRPWWRWLLWLLGLLLLLALLALVLFGLRGCDVAIPMLGLTPDEKPAAEAPVRPGLEPQAGADQGLFGIPWLSVPSFLRPDGVVPEGPVPEGVVPDGTIPNPQAPADAPPEASANAPETPADPPVPPDVPVPETTTPNTLPPPDVQAQEAPKGEDLVIPEDALKNGATDFLNGRWRSHTGLADSQTGAPLRMEYVMKDGKGKVRIYRKDGSVCEGDMTAAVREGRLQFEQTSDAVCPDGSGYNQARVICTPDAQGKAVCRGVNSNDGSGFSVSITR